MIIDELRIMRGPNMWSADHKKLIATKLSLNNYAAVTAAQMHYLKKFFYENYGINQSEEENTSHFLAAVFTDLALSLQPASDAFYKAVVSPIDGVYYAVFGYEIEEAGVAAANTAADIIIAVLQNQIPISADVAKKTIAEICKNAYPGPSTAAIIAAAEKRHIPYRECSGGYIVFGQGKHQRKISASIAESTSAIGVDIAGDKDITKQLLANAFVPVAPGILLKNEENLRDAIEEVGFPLVTKPLNGNQGKCITTNINDYDSLLAGFRLAKTRSNTVIIEKQIPGNDYRFLLIGYKLVAAAIRYPASVTGNGELTVRELIEAVNRDPNRGNGHENVLTKIKIDDHTPEILTAQNVNLNTVLKKGERVLLKTTANLSTGGTAEDVTDMVHPQNVWLAERIARIVGLDICGIDIMAPDVSTPITANGGAVLEVNAAPGLRMHLAPSKGMPRNVGDPIMELMYPDAAKSRIPIVAITGTNGKTTTTRLMAHAARKAGHNVGYTTTDGIYINELQVKRGDCSGPVSAQQVLHDPLVDFAVLESARGGLIRSGFAVDECDIGIVTNVAEDHLGLKDIYTIDDLAKVKSVIPKAVKKDGWAILNASDDFVYKMREGLHCNVALFSIDENNPRIIRHCKLGGKAAVLDVYKNIVIIDGERKFPLENVHHIPVTMDGCAEFMIENVLPVAMASYLLNFNEESLREAFRTFNPTSEQVPGRINKFTINDVNIIVDYAHNPHGLMALGKYLHTLEGNKTGIISGTGDRRDIDIIKLGRIAAEMYDDIIIRIDKDTRGRTPEGIIQLLVEGLQQIKPHIAYRIIPNTKDALQFAVEHCSPGSYVIISADDALDTIKITQEIAENYNQIQMQ